jgi:hypothetical protein
MTNYVYGKLIVTLLRKEMKMISFVTRIMLILLMTVETLDAEDGLTVISALIDCAKHVQISIRKTH